MLTSGRRALLPHVGHVNLPFSCSRIDRVRVTARWHLSQWYSYTGIAVPPTGLHLDPSPEPSAPIISLSGVLERVNVESAAYWMISSARARSDGGIVSPSALAVFWLMTSSNFVGCSIGMSPGLVPFKILSTKTALRRHMSRISVA